MTRSKKLPPIHPGTILTNEFLIPRKISQSQLATRINVPIKLVKEVCQTKQPINAELALRLGTYFGTSAELWLGLQQDYEQECLEDILEKKEIEKEVKPLSHSRTNGRLRKSL